MKQRLNLPNSITIFRILFAIPISIVLIENHYKLAFCLFLIAAASDIVDGFLARTLNQQTKLGSILDPMADKILINYTFLILATQGYIPILLLAVVISKDVILATGSTIEILSLKNKNVIEIKASMFGKVSTFFQIVVVALVFIKIFGVYFNKLIFEFFVYSTILLTILALLVYINKYKIRSIKNGG